VYFHVCPPLGYLIGQTERRRAFDAGSGAPALKSGRIGDPFGLLLVIGKAGNGEYRTWFPATQLTYREIPQNARTKFRDRLQRRFQHGGEGSSSMRSYPFIERSASGSREECVSLSFVSERKTDSE
jgi:hypothetical protein